jgi:RNA polymerase sigma-70 factor (ECF subfamily)
MLFKKPDLTQYTDEELMRLVCKGMEAAFSILYQRYDKRLFSFFVKMLNGDATKAEDMLQDIFLKLISKPEAFDASKKFSAWIFTVAANMCRNELRNNKVRQNVHQQILLTTDKTLADTSDKRDKEILKQKLNAALMDMDENGRMLFVLRYDQELPVREIAQVMDIPEGTVKSRLFYMLKELSKKLQGFHQLI